jgi:hypothetical protein
LLGPEVRDPLFEPYVRRLFARKPYDPQVTQPGVVKGLPLLQAAAE